MRIEEETLKFAKYLVNITKPPLSISNRTENGFGSHVPNSMKKYLDNYLIESFEEYFDSPINDMDCVYKDTEKV